MPQLGLLSCGRTGRLILKPEAHTTIAFSEKGRQKSAGSAGDQFWFPIWKQVFALTVTAGAMSWVSIRDKNTPTKLCLVGVNFLSINKKRIFLGFFAAQTGILFVLGCLTFL
jgi:hypothetical protein